MICLGIDDALTFNLKIFINSYLSLFRKNLIMRSIFIFGTLALITLSIASCSKEDSPQVVSKIVRTWKIKELLSIDNSNANQPDTTRFSQPEGASIEFTSNGFWIQKVSNIDILSPNEPGEFFVLSGFYKLDRNKLYRYLLTESDTLDVVLTDTSLLLSQEVDQEKAIISCRK